VPVNGVAAQIRAPELMEDGWILFAGAFDSRVAGVIDRLCIVEIANGGHVVGTLKRGYEAERWNVVPFVRGASFDNVRVVAAAPVLWIRPV